MNDFDWTSDIKAGETLGNIKLNNFEGYNIGDKITVTGDFYVPVYNGSDQEGWVNVNNEPFIIDDINKQLTRIIIRSINPSFYNDERNKKFLLNHKNQIYVGDTFDDDDKLLISRYIENLKEDNDFDWIKDIQPETEWDKEKYYVLDIRSLSGVKLRETIDDIWDFAYNMDYDVEIGVQYDNVGYI